MTFALRSSLHAVGRYQRSIIKAAFAICLGFTLGGFLIYHPAGSDALQNLAAEYTEHWSGQSGITYHTDYKHEGKHLSHEEQLELLTLYKKFIKEDIFDPIIADEHIDQCPLLNNGAHYHGGKKKGHYNGPLKESYAMDDVYTKQKLLEYLKLSDEEMGYITKSHEYIMQHLPKKFPDKLMDLFESKQNKNGYVYVGGGKFNYLALLALKALRDTGAVYPAEIILPTAADFDVTLCNTMFPILNARCVVLEEYLPPETKGRVSKYQTKSAALLVNSFQNVLLLDADNMAIKNPDYLFNNAPFTTHGLITWPDMWRRSTSPLFYDIAGIEVDVTKRARNSYEHVVKDGNAKEHGYSPDWALSFHDSEGAVPEASTESGQIMVNKKTHLHTIFLSLYYNFHGPSYFYPILTQNSHGEGDKETYITAAHVLGQPYYQVEEYPRDFHRDHAKVQRGTQRTILAIGQYDPVVEAQQANVEKQDAWTAYKYSNPRSHWEYKIWNDSELLFLHCNQPKLYAWDLIRKNGARGFKNLKGERQRLYDGLLDQLHGYDYESKLVGILEWFWCEHPSRVNGLPDFDDTQICKELQEQKKWLGENLY
ncbi:hypothetical protein BON22_4208 [Cyberlindnera fabianii]|uniref:Alpha-1,2-mannosyltransferase MNN2 n=1 Tax=Cyberlindnera fabianii TaxID=36022 RepID=A0A1V2L281_CYBFA|nr:hypothetical protein BON22_4208 [Cyberlindnera fabianii]